MQQKLQNKYKNANIVAGIGITSISLATIIFVKNERNVV